MRQTLIKALAAFVTIASVAFAMLSCGGRGGRAATQDEGEAYLSSLTKADTASLLSIADSCMTLMANGEYEKALAGVGYVDGETLDVMTPEMVARTAPRSRVSGCMASSAPVSNSLPRRTTSSGTA